MVSSPVCGSLYETSVRAKSVVRNRLSACFAVAANVNRPVEISIRGASKSFSTQSGERVTVFTDLSFDVYRGEFLALVGPSGCGKSTLLNAICGEVDLDGGSIMVESNGNKGQRRSISVVWQEDALMPWKTAMANVEFPMIARGVDVEKRRETASKWLKTVGLDGFLHSYPLELSQGMRKRVGIAAALAPHPRILLLDEPFSALDLYTKLEIENELLSLWAEAKITVVMVTHDVHEAVGLADRIIVLTSRPATLRAVHLNPLPRPRNLRSLYGEPQFHDQVRQVWALMK